MTSTSVAVSHRGPPLVLLASVHIVLFFGSLLVLNGPTEGTWPMPGADPTRLVAFFRANTALLSVAGMLQFGSAVPLLLYAATASSRLRHLGVGAAGTTIALAGGVAAAVLLAGAGLGMVVAADTLHPATAALVHRLVFVIGGPGHVTFLGLLLAGIAVTALVARLLPKWLCGAMLAVAVVAELATLALVVQPLGFLVALGRFGGMAVLLTAGALLPVRRVPAHR